MQFRSTRWRSIPAILTFVFAVLLAAIASAAPRVNHVFIVSFDGGKPAVMQQSQMPALLTMVKEGASAWNAQTIFPSVTLITHTSMLTGLSPEKHHITWNSWSPDKGMITVPTVFSLAKKQGLSTAMIFGKEKFEHLNIPDSVDYFSSPGYECALVAKGAAEHIADKKPNLCFIHFADTDGAGHKFGWGSPEQMTAFAEEDSALKLVREAIDKAGISGDSVVIMTADHGGHNRSHGTNSPEDMTIPWIAWGKGVRAGFQIQAPITTYDTTATALWLLDVPIPAEFDGKPVTSAFEESVAANTEK